MLQQLPLIRVPAILSAIYRLANLTAIDNRHSASLAAIIGAKHIVESSHIKQGEMRDERKTAKTVFSAFATPLLRVADTVASCRDFHDAV